jgi:hypothetical protein
MSDRSPAPDPQRPQGYPGTPGWVKAMAIVLLVVLLLAAFIVISGIGGPHGPQRHGASAHDVPGPVIRTSSAA